MTEIAKTDVTPTIIKEWQVYTPINDPAEHQRHVIADVTIETGSNADYPADGIDISNLFTAGDDDDLGIDANHILWAEVMGGVVYDGANEAVADAYPAAIDISALKLILRSVEEDGSDATAPLKEGAITTVSAGNDMTFRLYVFGRKRGI